MNADFKQIVFATPSRAVIACLLLAAAFGAQAQQYRWVDERGRVQYTDTPPPPNAKRVEKKMLGAVSAPVGQEPFALQQARKKSPVKLYSSPDCGPSCDDARKLLSQRGIPFSETIVTQAPQIEELKQVSGSGMVPVMMVGNAVQNGFEAESFHRALDLAGYPRSNPVRAATPSVPLPKPAVPAASAGAPANLPNAEPAKPGK